MNLNIILDKRRALTDGSFPIKLSINNFNKTVYVSLKISAHAKEFDETSGLFITTDRKTKDQALHKNATIRKVLERANQIKLDLISQEKDISADQSGLSDKSKCPLNPVNTKVTSDLESMILDLQKKKRWGSQRISSHLLRKKITLSPMAVWRVLSRHQVNLL